MSINEDGDLQINHSFGFYRVAGMKLNACTDYDPEWLRTSTAINCVIPKLKK